ncbi:hypothetical protein Ae201684P_012505 [Aphanomyces euteiches]|nr:hypothetical protein Ae201684P_012505 [Aphanomyces euteiches]
MRTTAASCLLGVLILAAALFTHRIGVQRAVESTDNDIRRFEHQKDHVQHHGQLQGQLLGQLLGQLRDQLQGQLQGQLRDHRPVPPPVPAIPPPYIAPPGAPPNGPRPPPAPPVPRPAGAPSPIPYGPLRPVVYVRPRIVRRVVVRTPGYIYYPKFVAPVVVVRPYMTLPPAFWTSNACYRNYCFYDYNHCLNYFGDACFCYPGLLRCVHIACYSFYQPLYDHCNPPYPLAADPNHPPLPIDTPADVASALLDTTPPIVQYSVVAVVF